MLLEPSHAGTGEKELAQLQKLSCEICLPDIERYYDTMADIVALTDRLLAIDEDRNRSSRQLLQPGRIVVLNDGVSDSPSSDMDR